MWRGGRVGAGPSRPQLTGRDNGFNERTSDHSRVKFHHLRIITMVTPGEGVRCLGLETDVPTWLQLVGLLLERCLQLRTEQLTVSDWLAVVRAASVVRLAVGRPGGPLYRLTVQQGGKLEIYSTGGMGWIEGLHQGTVNSCSLGLDIYLFLTKEDSPRCSWPADRGGMERLQTKQDQPGQSSGISGLAKYYFHSLGKNCPITTSTLSSPTILRQNIENFLGKTYNFTSAWEPAERPAAASCGYDWEERGNGWPGVRRGEGGDNRSCLPRWCQATPGYVNSITNPQH